MEQNKDLAYLSKKLGTIDINAPIEKNLALIEKKDWNRAEVLEIFRKLKFNRFIDRFDLVKNAEYISNRNGQIAVEAYDSVDSDTVERIKNQILSDRMMYYYLDENEFIIYIEKYNICYILKDIKEFKNIFEDNSILKCSYKQKEQYKLLWDNKIASKNMMFDVSIAGYILNSNVNKYTLEYLANEYLNIDVNEYLNLDNKKEEQLNIFDNMNNEEKKNKTYIFAYLIYKLYNILKERMIKEDSYNLFQTIEMPLTEVLASMEYEGVFIDKNELLKFGNELKEKIEKLTEEIYNLSGEEFNINSTKQLGEVLFKKMGLTVKKKTKTGYSTDVEVLEKLKHEHPVIEKILEYRNLQKINSTYVDGLIPYIDELRKNPFKISSNSYTNRKNKFK